MWFLKLLNSYVISKWVVWYIIFKHTLQTWESKAKMFYFLLLWFHPEDTWQITDAEFLLISEKAETDLDFFLCSNILLM